MVEGWKKLKTSNDFSSFIVCSNQNRSPLVRDLLSYSSLFVCQFYEDKSLALRARDLIFFTTDLQIITQQITVRADLLLKHKDMSLDIFPGLVGYQLEIGKLYLASRIEQGMFYPKLSCIQLPKLACNKV